MKANKTILLIVCISVFFMGLEPALSWSNGGYSANPADPDYGTHDWIAQHALDFLPANEKQFITDNLAVYLYGTELPDNNQATDGFGDTAKHHIYYSAIGTLVDDASAQRAQSEYNKALNCLKTNDYANASKTAGAMTHYIVDVAVFGHVMGASTAWKAETHHSDYENYVTARTESYSSTFNRYLIFDGSLTNLSAYNATVNLAYDTTFGGSSQLGCVWMDDNYDWNNSEFSGRCRESLNLAVNAVTDVLHTLYVEAKLSPTQTPTITPTQTSTVTPTPTDSPTTTSTTSPTSATQNTSPTPIAPEFPAIQTLIVTMTMVMLLAVAYKKNAPKTS